MLLLASLETWLQVSLHAELHSLLQVLMSDPLRTSLPVLLLDLQLALLPMLNLLVTCFLEQSLLPSHQGSYPQALLGPMLAVLQTLLLHLQ